MMTTEPTPQPLFSADDIARRVAELGAEITDFYRDSPLTVVALTNGAMFFAADLLRHIQLPLYVDTLSVASYRADRRGDQFEFRSQLKLDPTGRRILLVDEVLDSGVTLQRVSDFLRQRHDVLDVRTAVIVSKAIARPPEGLPQADWTGFSAPDGYLVGYGLDSHELYRNLPYIAVLK